MSDSKSIAQKLHNAQIAIGNTLGIPVIQEAVTELGYDPDHMQIGQSLYDSALAAVQAKRPSKKSKDGDFSILECTKMPIFGIGWGWYADIVIQVISPTGNGPSSGC